MEQVAMWVKLHLAPLFFREINMSKQKTKTQKARVKAMKLAKQARKESVLPVSTDPRRENDDVLNADRPDLVASRKSAR